MQSFDASYWFVAMRHIFSYSSEVKRREAAMLQSYGDSHLAEDGIQG